MKKIIYIFIAFTITLSIPSQSYAVTYATWNPSDKSTQLTLSGGNLTGQGGAGGVWAGVRSTIGKASGKWYWEITTGASDGFIFYGIANTTWGLDNTIFSDANGWGYTGVSGMKANGSGEVAYGSTWGTGDKISVLLDMDAGTLTFWKNGVSQGQAFSGITGTLYAMMGPDGSANAATANFGATAFTYTPPAGYCQGLSDTCVGGGSTPTSIQSLIRSFWWW